MMPEKNDATHAYCRKCSEIQPVRWEHFHQEIYVGVTKARTFTGMTMICEVCDFELAQIGHAHTPAVA